ncbi:hypothetical protein ABN098_19210 [Proteus terrae]
MHKYTRMRDGVGRQNAGLTKKSWSVPVVDYRRPEWIWLCYAFVYPDYLLEWR